MSNVNLSIAVDENYLNQIQEVAQNLQSAGMNVEQMLDNLGIITGSCDSEKVESLSQVEGVSHVELSREYQLPSPESDLQ
ncbi:keto-hydroxyglutarate-aldolase/keto-deoxy-phosphogluconate aldolase [Richelia sinica FACHB-800]|uniref:Keto-hydroxyglutarate-aldolase/keto-deoxy-phosphogluconate aldolase n=1 Tax=Richelia sinica FACHB-800 TaxID=1357546 RepID=A0A975TBA2_9NOST|nr:ketohydroxyglutarate aldolase [Richelia sinica]MBD2665494.1 ketohydroxyglutarate aldolase [Richelia sinica FACHB-800]QXE25638.1 keto-hydroxyglutarate-aldolase/keto-deoxy-phosphogluconate aldolase [Richelia sinica FACHB-800]